MKVTIPIDRWDPARGGTERYLERLAWSLCSRGHEVLVVCIDAPGTPSSRSPKDGGTAPELAVHRIHVPRRPRWLRELLFARAAARYHRACGRDVLLAVRHAIEADVYQPHGSSFVATRKAHRRAQPPALRWLHTVGERLRPSLWVLRWLDRELFRRCPEVLTITLSRKVEDDFQEAYPGLRLRSVRIPNAVDLARFHDEDRATRSAGLRARFGVPSDARIALFLAHHPRLKGLEPAVAAVALAPGWHLLAGGRRGASLLKQAARRHGAQARTRFLGEVEDARALLSGADAFLLPTLHDPCSLASLEAIACGTPVITTRHNGAVDLIEPAGAGWVVKEPDDSRGLALGLERVGAAWEEFHARALSLRPAIDWDRHVERMEAALEEGAQTARNRVPRGAGRG